MMETAEQKVYPFDIPLHNGLLCPGGCGDRLEWSRSSPDRGSEYYAECMACRRAFVLYAETVRLEWSGFDE